MRNNKGGYLFLSSTMVVVALIMPGGFFRMIRSQNPTHPPTCRTGVFVETVSSCPHQTRISAAGEGNASHPMNSSTTSASIVMFWS